MKAQQLDFQIKHEQYIVSKIFQSAYFKMECQLRVAAILQNHVRPKHSVGSRNNENLSNSYPRRDNASKCLFILLYTQGEISDDDEKIGKE